MAEIIEGVKPTRMQLLEIRKKKQLAKNGHKLLSEKRDALISQFFQIIDVRENLRKKVDSKLKDAFNSLIEAEMIMGDTAVADVARQVKNYGEVEATTLNIMGVLTPQMEIKDIEKKLDYGFLSTSSKLDEAAFKFRELLKDLVKLAEIEGALENLAIEIEKTKRKGECLRAHFHSKI
ncbi:V-type ATPase, D subunit [Aciduliprofundum boonei T469]|nr:V-type ATPase, D subunit [Aciduliprofundum boonei T469]